MLPAGSVYLAPPILVSVFPNTEYNFTLTVRNCDGRNRNSSRISIGVFETILNLFQHLLSFVLCLQSFLVNCGTTAPPDYGAIINYTSTLFRGNLTYQCALRYKNSVRIATCSSMGIWHPLYCPSGTYYNNSIEAFVD